MSQPYDTLDLNEIGREKFHHFCRHMARILTDSSAQFDLLVGAGNSGIAMLGFTTLLAKALHTSHPTLLLVPYFRFQPHMPPESRYAYNDEESMLKALNSILVEPFSPKTALFVDDEIGSGSTVLGTLKLINTALEQRGRPPLKQFTIVAEDQGFHIPITRPELTFIPYDTESHGLNNAIFLMNPWSIEKPLIDLFGEDLDFPFHWRTNVLLNLPLKDVVNGQPVLSYKAVERAKQAIPHFDHLQAEYRAFVLDEIKAALGELS